MRVLPARAISLEVLSEAYVPALRVLFEDARVQDTFPLHPPRGLSSSCPVGDELVGFEAGVRQPFAILEDGHAVGLCGLSRQGAPLFERDVYFWLGFAHWGRGIATAAVGLLVEVARRLTHVTCLTSQVLTRNPRSRRVLERNAFEVVGTVSVTLERLGGEEHAWRLERAIDSQAPNIEGGCSCR